MLDGWGHSNQRRYGAQGKNSVSPKILPDPGFVACAQEHIGTCRPFAELRSGRS